MRTVLTKPVSYAMHLELGSWLQRFAFVNGGYEERVSRLLAQLFVLRAGQGAVYDVGANVGLISIPTCLLLDAQDTDEPEVLAFEPLAENVIALNANIQMNRLADRIRVFGVALGDRPRVARIQPERIEGGQFGSGTANIVPETVQAGALREISVRSLDALREDGSLDVPCKILKIDTDGYDLNVLLGARQLLAADRPFVFGEFDAKSLAWHRQSMGDIEELALELGYAILWSVRSGGARFQVVRPYEFEQDLLAVPREWMSSVGWCLDSTVCRSRPSTTASKR